MPEGVCCLTVFPDLFTGLSDLHRIEPETAPIRPDEGRVEPSLVPQGESPLVERLRPKRFVEPFHVHPSLEINFLDGVRFTHVFSGLDLPLPGERLILFWGAVPHRARAVSGDGHVMNVYLSLTQLLGIAPRGPLVGALLQGDVIASRSHAADDRAMLLRFLQEQHRPGPDWGRLHLQELGARLTRLAMEGWEVLHRAPARGFDPVGSLRGARHVRAMLEVMSDRYFEPVTIPEIAASAGVSAGHGSEVFHAITGKTPSAYLTALRLSHARAMLAATGLSIAQIATDCGFGSVSRFYEAFRSAEGCPPAKWRRLQTTPQGTPAD